MLVNIQNSYTKYRISDFKTVNKLLLSECSVELISRIVMARAIQLVNITEAIFSHVCVNITAAPRTKTLKIITEIETSLKILVCFPLAS